MKLEKFTKNSVFTIASKEDFIMKKYAPLVKEQMEKENDNEKNNSSNIF